MDPTMLSIYSISGPIYRRPLETMERGLLYQTTKSAHLLAKTALHRKLPSLALPPGVDCGTNPEHSA